MRGNDNGQGMTEYALLTALLALTALGMNQKFIQGLLGYFRRLVNGISLPFTT